VNWIRINQAAFLAYLTLVIAFEWMIAGSVWLTRFELSHLTVIRCFEFRLSADVILDQDVLLQPPTGSALLVDPNQSGYEFRFLVFKEPDKTSLPEYWQLNFLASGFDRGELFRTANENELRQLGF